MIKKLRDNIGTIIASFGLTLLCVLVFGDLGEIMTEKYWENVLKNLTGLGFMSVALTMIQVSIKQGVSEQALQKGLNSENTTAKYTEHRKLIKDNTERHIYLPYFLSIYNERNTLLKKREFLVDNNFKTEQALFLSKNWRLIRKYKSIRVYLTASRIKWATTDIIYNKYGQIITLAEHRARRTIRGIVMGLIFMIGVTLLTNGLFAEETTVKWYEKLITLGTFIVVISITSVLSIIREYEKGAFGVPNELEEINGVWNEFAAWIIPQWIIDEVEGLNKQKEVKDETTKGNDSGTDISVKSKESKSIKDNGTDNLLVIPCNNDNILLHDNP